MRITRRAVPRVEELAPRMRPAGNFADRVVRPQIDMVVAAVGIGMEVTFESCEELGRSIAGATFSEVIHRVGMLLANVGPEASLATSFFAARQYGHGRIVGPQHGRLKHQLFLSLVERPQAVRPPPEPNRTTYYGECAGRGA